MSLLSKLWSKISSIGGSRGSERTLGDSDLERWDPEGYTSRGAGKIEQSWSYDSAPSDPIRAVYQDRRRRAEEADWSNVHLPFDKQNGGLRTMLSGPTHKVGIGVNPYTGRSIMFLTMSNLTEGQSQHEATELFDYDSRSVLDHWTREDKTVFAKTACEEGEEGVKRLVDEFAMSHMTRNRGGPYVSFLNNTAVQSLLSLERSPRLKHPAVGESKFRADGYRH